MEQLRKVLVFVLLAIASVGCKNTDLNAWDEAPGVPSNPYPIEGSTDKSTRLLLSWSCDDNVGDGISYDVFIGTTNNPTTQIGINLTSTTLLQTELTTNTQYYWKVNAKNKYGEATTSGEVWSFTTGSGAFLQDISNPYPSDVSIGQSTWMLMSWSCNIQIGGEIIYDVFIGTTSNPTTQIGIDLTSTTLLQTELTTNTKYYWKVIAKNKLGEATTSGEVWSFTTGSGAFSQDISNPYPADGSTEQLTLMQMSWSCNIQVGDGIYYDVFIGTTSNPTTQIGTDVTSTSLQAVFTTNTKYYWKVIAKNKRKEAITSGVVWSFTTGSVIKDHLMVQVTGGTFQMGSTNSLDYGANPPHTVTLGSFSIDKYEITYEKWTTVAAWGATHGYTDLPTGRNGYSPVGSNNPVTEESWYDIVKWCNARSEKDGLTPVYYTSNTLGTVYRTGQIDLGTNAVKWTATGYRLPTEAEWEFAAKGGVKAQTPTPYIYSGSNTIDGVAWYYTNSPNSTHTVGTKTANELGLYDMSGNVWEWCWDWYGTYQSISQTDPKGASSGSYRVLRGGSFSDVGNLCRSADRYDYYPNFRDVSYGFRCVQD